MLNIKIKLEDNIKEFKVNDMEDLVSQITNELKDHEGNPISEEDRKNAYWMSYEMDAGEIKLKDNMILKLICNIKSNNIVRGDGFMDMVANIFRGRNSNKTPGTAFILRPESELIQQSANFARTTIHLAKRTRYYQW